MKEELELIKKVQACQTLEALASVILDASEFSISEEYVKIKGLRKELDASKMVDACLSMRYHMIIRGLTRNFGIRQQACYIIISELIEEGKTNNLLMLTRNHKI